MARVALFGKYGQKNLGNDLTLEVAIANLRLRRPDDEIVCVCSGPAEVESRFGVVAKPFRPPDLSDREHKNPGLLARTCRLVVRTLPNQFRAFSHALETFRPGDMLVIAGTGLLEQDDTITVRWPLEILKWCVAARVRRATVSFLSFGAGPVPNQWSRLAARCSLRLARVVSYRDQPGFDYMNVIGLDTRRHRIVPDIAFHLPGPPQGDSHRPPSDRPVIGVGMMDYYGLQHATVPSDQAYTTYIERMAGVLHGLLEAGCEVRLICGDTHYDNAPITDVLSHLEALGVPRGDARVTRAPIQSNTDLFQTITQLDAVISPRFHNLIVGLLLFRPVISVSYHTKHDALLQHFGLGDYCNDIDHLDPRRIVAQCLQLLARRDSIRDQIEPIATRCREMVNLQFDEVFGPEASRRDGQDFLNTT